MFTINRKLDYIKQHMINNKLRVASDKIYLLENTVNGPIAKSIDFKEAYYNFLSEGIKNIYDNNNYPYKFKSLQPLPSIELINE